jgi:hypothetical protein
VRALAIPLLREGVERAAQESPPLEDLRIMGEHEGAAHAQPPGVLEQRVEQQRLHRGLARAQHADLGEVEVHQRQRAHPDHDVVFGGDPVLADALDDVARGPREQALGAYRRRQQGDDRGNVGDRGPSQVRHAASRDDVRIFMHRRE